MMATKLRAMARPLTSQARRWALRKVDPLSGHRAEDSEFAHPDVLERVAPYTMTSVARRMALVDAVEYVVKAGVPGDFVECGVWRGGSMMAVALTLLRLGVTDRDLWLYDTFEGMPEPTEHDVGPDGHAAKAEFELRKVGSDSSDWCRSGIDEVRENLAGTGYPTDRIRLVKGKVEDTIPGEIPGRIACLRLDTDWYASTRQELLHLYPLLSSRGVLILDDYGHWKGARQAVDEYFSAEGITLLLSRVDYSGRMAIKP